MADGREPADGEDPVRAEIARLRADRKRKRQSVDDLIRICARETVGRRAAETALERCLADAHFLSELIDNSSQPVAIVTPDGRFRIFNNAFCGLTGYSRAEILEISWADTLTPPEWRKPERERLRELAATGAPVRYEKEYVRKDGSRIPVELLVHVLRDTRGTPEFYYGFITDITERKRFEDSLQESRRRLRRLAAHQQKAIEEERARIAREIHDELSQQMVVQRMDLFWLRKRIPPGHAALDAKIGEMIGALDNTRHVIERIIREMRPQILDDLGLVSALEWLAKELEERTGLRIGLAFPGPGLAIDPAIGTAIFRIVQEALTNVVRHASAGRARLSLRKRGDALLLRVEDDGRGIATDAVGKGGTHGLMGIQERAMNLGGSMAVAPRRGGGTVLTVSIPIPPQRCTSAAK